MLVLVLTFSVYSETRAALRKETAYGGLVRGGFKSEAIGGEVRGSLIWDDAGEASPRVYEV